MTNNAGYFYARDRNGTEDAFVIADPSGDELAFIHFWDEPDTDHAAKAEANVRLIVDALNAYHDRATDPESAG